MCMNLIFYANNIEHAINILNKMLLFLLETESEYQQIKMYKDILNNKNKWKITLAPKNQFFKVGWAWNDTV